jgi:hypothetical protein
MKGFWIGISHKHIYIWFKANKNASMMYFSLSNTLLIAITVNRSHRWASFCVCARPILFLFIHSLQSLN